MTDVGNVPMVATGGGGWGGDGFGGILGLVLVLALLGGNGFGGLGGGGNAVTNDFLYSALNTNTQAGFSNIQGDFNFQALLGGQAGIQRDILEQTNVFGRAIDNQTWRLAENSNANTQRILDHMSAQESLRQAEKINELQRVISEKTVIDAVFAASKPKEAVPAYIQPSPYAAYPPFGGGFGGYPYGV